MDLPKILASGRGRRAGINFCPSTSIQSADGSSAITNTPGSGNTDASAGPDGVPPDELDALRIIPLLATVLDAITRSLPFELVIAVDQGEDLVTLVRTAQQRERRAKALRMLAELGNSAARCKILFPLRSQYLGQLVSLFPNEELPPGWRTHYLPPLAQSVMVDALLWPTNREEIPHSPEIPSQKYRFAFEEGLAQQIVAEAVDAAADDLQSPLALIQATGALLYEKKVIGKNQNVVRTADVKELGGVRAAPLKCLDSSIEKIKIPSPAQRELRQLFTKLYTSHADGTVSRDLVPASELKTHWKTAAEPVESAVNKATDEAGLFEIQQLMIGGQSDIYVSLPQDSLAQLGRKIRAERESRAFSRRGIVDTLWIMIPFSFLVGSSDMARHKSVSRRPGGELLRRCGPPSPRKFSSNMH